MPLGNKTLAWVLFTILTLIWGSAYILIKIGNESFTPYQVGSIRILTAAIVFLPMAFFHFKKVKSTKEWFYLFVGGCIGSYVPANLFALAQTQVSSSTAGILSSLTPVFTVLVSVIFFKNKLTTTQIIGLIIGLLGAVYLASFKNGSISLDSYHWLFIVLATICYAINLNILKYKLPDLSPIAISSISITLISPVALFNLFNSDFIDRLSPTENIITSIVALVILGITATAIALVLFNRMVKIASPQFASATTYAIPVVAILWGLLDNEQIGFNQLIAMTVILSGIFLIKKG